MYGIIRMLFWLLIFVIVMLQVRKNKIANTKKNMVIIIVIICILWTGSMMIPIENCFVTFESPERSFNYINSESVKEIISGDTTDLVIGEGNDYVYLIIPKNEKGWKLGRGIDFKTVAEFFDDGIIVQVYRFKESEEYYVEVEEIKGNTCEIKDNEDSCFQESKYTVVNETRYRYYAYVPGIDDNYTLTVNGKDIPVKRSE